MSAVLTARYIPVVQSFAGRSPSNSPEPTADPGGNSGQ
jgi:hypothetical protein